MFLEIGWRNLAIDAAENEDYSVCEELHQLLKAPYDEQIDFETIGIISDLNGQDTE